MVVIKIFCLFSFDSTLKVKLTSHEPCWHICDQGRAARSTCTYCSQTFYGTPLHKVRIIPKLTQDFGSVLTGYDVT